MLNTFRFHLNITSAEIQKQRAGWVWGLWFVVLTGLSGILALALLMFGPNPAFIAWLLFAAGSVLILYQPRYGIYLILFLTLVGDGIITYWFPFAKNLSSAESLMYLNDALIFSPLEIYLVLTFVSWLGRGAMERKLNFYTGRLFWPALVFILFIVFGMVYGFGTGGNVNIGLWEARPIFYLVAMLVLSSNLLTRREHANHLFWTAVIALFIEGLFGTYHYFFVLKADLTGIESMTEHSVAIHINSIFVFVLAAWLYKASWPKRLFIPLMLPPMLLTYMAAQRRAAFVALAIALALMAIILLKEKPLAFWIIVPPAFVAGLLYVALFWNSNSALAMPAQTLKSIVAVEQANAKDRSSNLYRQLENINSRYTIRQSPLTGVGFGQKVKFLVPLPDISFFEWWEYMVHNSIIWIWIKTGIGGFIAMLFLIGSSIMAGVRALLRAPNGDLKAIALTGTLYIIMHFVYAYVDISWDIQSMVYVGAVMGWISGFERIVTRHPADTNTRKDSQTPARAMLP